MEEQRRHDEVERPVPKRETQTVRRDGTNRVRRARHAADREVPPLQVHGHDADHQSRLPQTRGQPPGHGPRAGADVQNGDRAAAEGPRPGHEVPLERTRRSPAAIHDVEILERPPHLLDRQVGVVEPLAAGAPGRDERAHEATSPVRITRALFLEPKPMVLQRACSNDAGREAFAT